jgi:hypothetical protein
VALHLTKLSKSIGASPVERIPVLGREGPDITTNELGLVIDVKSRLEVPKGYFKESPASFGDLIAVPLDQLLSFAGDLALERSDFQSVLVERWFEHMDQWRRTELPGGCSALVLHRPKKPIGKSMLIIHKNSAEELKCRITTLLQHSPLPTISISPAL